MRILKLLQIINVGKFENYTSTGNVGFNRNNLIYAENGKGKTTLSTIFRSNKVDDITLIVEKKRTRASDPFVIEILLEGNKRTLLREGNTGWSILNPDVEIFDSDFVNSNIYYGDHVDHNHKRNLYNLIIGSVGVNKAEEIDIIDLETKQVSDNIKELKKAIQSHIRCGKTIEEFISLPNNEHIDQEITSLQNEIDIIKDAEKIRAINPMKEFFIPNLAFENLITLLNKSIEEISRDAENRVKEHCKHLDDKSESWLKQGLAYSESSKKEACPFCGQEISSIELIQIYRQYFNKSYSDLKKEISLFYEIFVSDFDNNSLLEIQQILEKNNIIFEKWKEMFSFKNFVFDIRQLSELRTTIFNKVKQLTDIKGDSPLEKVILDNTLPNLITEYEAIILIAENYNNINRQNNILLTQKKNEILVQNLEEQNSNLLLLQDQKNRYTTEVMNLCTDYLNLSNENQLKKNLKQEKSDELKSYCESILETYRSRINSYLAKFGAEFSIVESKTQMFGGKPSTSYMLNINEVNIPLGSVETSGEPCFRTILSDGDKSTLAFAFFLAQLSVDQSIDKKTIIIDDPITSLDIHRKTQTYSEIKDFSNKCNQTILLSHDAFFLKLFEGTLPDVKTLKIIREGNHSTICEWDIFDETMPDYLRDYFRLEEFINNNDPDLRGVARCIRPVLEGNLRVKFPKSFGSKEWLHNFIEKIENSNSPSSLSRMKPHLGELRAICDYSNKYHHSTNPLADTENINEVELRTYAGRTLNLVETM